MSTTKEATKISQQDDLWKNMELGLIPDEEVRRLMKIGIEKRIKWGTKPTQQEQLAQLLDFTKSLRGMKMATEIETLENHKIYETPHSSIRVSVEKKVLVCLLMQRLLRLMKQI
ncbi:hypothetical protein MKX01_030697 [Papaver californicum]|nr:hypothetical protein MKX01_030697 [Papaver californicum]